MLGAGGLLWLFFDPLTALLLLIGLLLLILLHHLRHMARLVNWAQKPLGTPTPVAFGVWDYIFASLARRARSEREQRERLAHSLARFREASQALPDGVIYLSRQHTIEWINAAAAGYFGLDGERDMGRAITTLVREPTFVNYLRAPAELTREPLVLHSSRQEGLTLAVQVIPFGDDQEMVLARDITQLERLDTMRRDFVANVSHELKTPLTVVNGFIETMLDAGEDITPGESEHYLGLALQQSQRMQRLVDDLLQLSTLQANQLTSVEDPVDAGALVRSVLYETEQLSAGKHAIVLDAVMPATLLGCQKELHSAFSNLASNAVRYTPEGGTIRLSWRVAADGCGEFAVADNGIGIGPEHISRLTERFYRVDHGRSRETGGTGLGLAIVKHVLNRHQGLLLIRSQSGEGSCFTARFPAKRLRLPVQS
ncbi:phosphate regulon sensor histidine kinase PhoR [Uliginosibacterium sp. TH139]|uniref:phosphate regulon sensor histidine kinase PhoR n=1 Tax=Uliginosibacterium sp. TH139 TaxID=2067453 RepID=UPI000C7A419F|nr:phosphate regulon sensor histidine kinase PhoR [Uliginosibacterium sp. TH139]PLK50710.1 phosphate regulon sensor histidine kinase PhoR [Uliginosibacterium sp. TH139]